ncbi:hypothetical protein BJX62DRAFT_241927 [Aspergillus germanicus]
MALKQDLTSITTAAESHILSYCADTTSPTFRTSTERAAKLATYYLPTISLFAGGPPTQLSDQSLLVQLLSGPLNKIQGLALEIIGHRVEAVAENSAIIWLSLRVDNKVEVSNLVFFRKREDGKAGFEGGIFDGGAWLLKQLGLA